MNKLFYLLLMLVLCLQASSQEKVYFAGKAGAWGSRSFPSPTTAYRRPSA